MRILFLGTGAADWEDPGKHVNGGRRFTSQLLDETILLDCGPMTWEAIEEFGVDVDKLTDIVIGHPHSDHFNVAAAIAGPEDEIARFSFHKRDESPSPNHRVFNFHCRSASEHPAEELVGDLCTV